MSNKPSNPKNSGESLLYVEREQWIINYLMQYGKISIEDITNQFHVSNMTAWRDLKAIAEKNIAQKVYGGAVMRVDSPPIELAFEDKLKTRVEEKQRIAKCAVENFIKENQVIILEGSSTVREMIAFLNVQDLTVLTNGINTMTYCAKMHPHYSVIACGGLVRTPSLTLVGDVAEKFFQTHHAELIFLGGTSITLEDGIMDPHPLENTIKKIMSTRAKKIIALLDSSKFGKKSLTSTIPIEKIDVLITDKGLPKDFQKELEKSGLKLFVV